MYRKSVVADECRKSVVLLADRNHVVLNPVSLRCSAWEYRNDTWLEYRNGPVSLPPIPLTWMWLGGCVVG